MKVLFNVMRSDNARYRHAYQSLVLNGWLYSEESGSCVSSTGHVTSK